MLADCLAMGHIVRSESKRQLGPFDIEKYAPPDHPNPIR